MELFNLDKPPFCYWSTFEKVNYLQRRIIVYSLMYYELNETCVSDKVYDKVSKQLINLQNELSEEEFKNTTYYYAMYDFDGTTGFDIPDRLTDKDKKYLINLSIIILDNYRRENRRQIGRI